MAISSLKVNSIIEASRALAASEDVEKKTALETAVTSCLKDLIPELRASRLDTTALAKRVVAIAPEDRAEIERLIEAFTTLSENPSSKNQEILKEYISNFRHALNNVAVRVNEFASVIVDSTKVPYLEALLIGDGKVLRKPLLLE